MAIFITGDTHGDFIRFRPALFPQQFHLTKEDYVIICGDFGGLWDNGPEDEYWLNWLEERPFTTLFVDGNHENFHLLAQIAPEPWQGGQIQRLRPSVLRLMRGQIYTLQGLTFFTMGGASSHDIAGGILNPDDPRFKETHRRLLLQGIPHRINGVTWWQEELPCQEEYETARENLERRGWAVDCVITNCAPTFLQKELTRGQYRPDALTEFLEEVFQRCRFQHWYFGHYHQHRMLGTHCTLLYEEIVPIRT